MKTPKPLLYHFLCLCLSLVAVLCLTGCVQITTENPADASTDEANTDPANSEEATDPEIEETPLASFTIEAKARIADSEDRTWQTALEAHNGDTIELQLQYVNIDTTAHEDVNLSVALPAEFTYVEGSTVLYNDQHPDGATVDQDTIVTPDGIYLGAYTGRQEDAEQGANAYVRLTLTVNHDTQPGSHVINVTANARRIDEPEPASRATSFLISTPLASMP